MPRTVFSVVLDAWIDQCISSGTAKRLRNLSISSDGERFDSSVGVQDIQHKQSSNRKPINGSKFDYEVEVLPDGKLEIKK